VEENTTSEPTYSETTTTTDNTDWEYVSQLIADKIAAHATTFDVIEAVHGSQIGGQIRILHEATLGDLLVSFFLAALTGTILLKWLFSVVWGR